MSNYPILCVSHCPVFIVIAICNNALRMTLRGYNNGTHRPVLVIFLKEEWFQGGFSKEKYELYGLYRSRTRQTLKILLSYPPRLHWHPWTSAQISYFVASMFKPEWVQYRNGTNNVWHNCSSQKCLSSNIHLIVDGNESVVSIVSFG